MSSGQIRRVTEQQDTSKSGILFVVVRTRRAAFSPCCFHRAISPCGAFTMRRFHRAAISPSAILPCRDFAVSRFHQAISPCGAFTVRRFRRLRFCRVAISLYGNFTERDFTMSRCHHAAFVSSGSLYPTESRSCLLYTSPSPRDRQKSRMPSSA